MGKKEKNKNKKTDKKITQTCKYCDGLGEVFSKNSLVVEICHKCNGLGVFIKKIETDESDES